MVKTGIKENWQQFTLLIIITAFVGGMVGMERSLLPKLAESAFHVASKTAIFSFIMAFGISKAITNYFTGSLSNRYGRRTLLIAGWCIALPIPWLLMYAPSWNWIIVANILLGVSQGLSWSSTVVMKIDLVDEKNRGLAVGLNEFAGYLAVGLVTFLVSNIASRYGLRPYPFFVGVVFSVAGLLLSVFFAKDTRVHMQAEGTTHSKNAALDKLFWQTSLFNKNLSSLVQGGLTNNLNDGMMWGLYPVLLTTRGFSLAQIGVLTAIYPACWGIGQLITGRLSDYIAKKKLLFTGLVLQACVLLLLIPCSSYSGFATLSVLLGLGKAMVYPTFTSAVAENAHPEQRAASVGIYRFWRDLGYAIGAFLTGILADSFGLSTTIGIVGGITLLSAFILQTRMKTA